MFLLGSLCLPSASFIHFSYYLSPCFQNRNTSKFYQLKSHIRSILILILMEDSFYLTIERYPLSQDILKQHEEIEELLESHLLDCNSLNDDLTYLMVTIENSEDLVS